ncbi:MAG: glutamine synthetase family protein [Eubacteriales bacterium]|nr:glutamine synthetase family protein [Eubacteriales bacterium]
MDYSAEEVKQYILEEDVKFIRLAFCDVFGKQKNISVMPSETDRAFRYGIAIDGSAVEGFGGITCSDLFLYPDSSTIAPLPWRPDHGKVIRMFCDIKYPDGRAFEGDTRTILKRAVEEAKKEGVSFVFGSEMEFYLFKCDENGNRTDEPYDSAGYMDIAPEDKGENVRREICLTLEQMGIYPESSHHEEGPGQNEIDFKYSEPLSAADNAATFRTVVRTVAARNGLCADFSPKPINGKPGNGMHINFSVKKDGEEDVMSEAIAGIMSHIPEITVFLNPCEKSYERLGCDKAPCYISWSEQNRSQLIRIPAAKGECRRAELRSPDPSANPYLVLALLIYSALDGIKNKMKLMPPINENLYNTSDEEKLEIGKLPATFCEAKTVMMESEFVKGILPEVIISEYAK